MTNTMAYKFTTWWDTSAVQSRSPYRIFTVSRASTAVTMAARAGLLVAYMGSVGMDGRYSTAGRVDCAATLCPFCNTLSGRRPHRRHGFAEFLDVARHYLDALLSSVRKLKGNPSGGRALVPDLAQEGCIVRLTCH